MHDQNCDRLVRRVPEGTRPVTLPTTSLSASTFTCLAGAREHRDTMMNMDQETWREAQRLVELLGDYAWLEAVTEADRRAAAGDAPGKKRWLRIGLAIEWLQNWTGADLDGTRH
jgi:hypothetical protein